MAFPISVIVKKIENIVMKLFSAVPAAPGKGVNEDMVFMVH